MRRRFDSRIRYGLTAVVALALAWTAIALISSPPASAEEIPGPLLLAGSDCDENGPFVQYRVTNETGSDETLTISIDEQAVIGSARVDSDETKRGRIEWRGSAAKSVVLEARWATNDEAPVSTITVAPNPCVTTSATDLTGPSFMAGTECRDDAAIIRWWMSNSADEHRATYVSISSEDGTVGETIWPGDGSSELMFAGAQTSGVSSIPAEYALGSPIRVSGWSEGSFGVAETWTQMIIPVCNPAAVLAVASSSTSVVGGSDTTADPLDDILSTSPPVATTAGAGSGTTTTAGPNETTTTLPGQTTTTLPGATTTSTTTSTTTPGSTTTQPPGSTTTTTSGPTTTTTRPPVTTTTTTTTTTAPPSDLDSPVFLAGADCNANGAFIRYRVTNNNSTAQTLNVTFNGATKVSTVSVGAGQSKWGTFGASGNNDPKPVVASWVGQAGTAAPTLLMRPSICESGLPQPARGPSFVAGQDCSGSTPVVRWWMKNSAPTTQPMSVTISKANNSGERTVWPSSGSFVDLDADVQTAGVYTPPSGYNSVGQEIRMRGWWRQIDPSAHNRVGIVIGSCN